jgi:hypothetical protein
MDFGYERQPDLRRCTLDPHAATLLQTLRGIVQKECNFTDAEGGKSTKNPTDANAINEKLANGEVKPDARTSKKPKKTKEKKKEKQKKTVTKTPPKELTLPVNGFVNKYNFLRVSDALLEKLGWPIDQNVDVTLDVQDGAIFVKKKA